MPSGWFWAGACMSALRNCVYAGRDLLIKGTLCNLIIDESRVVFFYIQQRTNLFDHCHLRCNALHEALVTKLDFDNVI